jgi:hypothetical protein
MYDMHAWKKQQELDNAKYEKFISELKVGDYYKIKKFLLSENPFVSDDNKIVKICEIKENHYNEKWVKLENSVWKHEAMTVQHFYECYDKMTYENKKEHN